MSKATDRGREIVDFITTHHTDKVPVPLQDAVTYFDDKADTRERRFLVTSISHFIHSDDGKRYQGTTIVPGHAKGTKPKAWPKSWGVSNRLTIEEKLERPISSSKTLVISYDPEIASVLSSANITSKDLEPFMKGSRILEKSVNGVITKLSDKIKDGKHAAQLEAKDKEIEALQKMQKLHEDKIALQASNMELQNLLRLRDGQ